MSQKILITISTLMWISKSLRYTFDFACSQGDLGGDIHLVGHSLGAHLVGKIGRTFKEASGKPVERITGEFKAKDTSAQN